MSLSRGQVLLKLGIDRFIKCFSKDVLNIICLSKFFCQS